MRFNRPYGALRCPRLTGMSGPTGSAISRPRRIRRGATLTLVFASVLATGAATGSWSERAEQGRKSRSPAARSVASSGDAGDTADEAADAAAEAMADGKSGKKAAEDAVSRSGDRWGSVYSPGSSRSSSRPSTAPTPESASGPGARPTGASRCPGSSAAAPPTRPAYARATGSRTSTAGAWRGSPSPRWCPCCAATAPAPAVALGLERGTRAWSETLHRARLSTDPVTVTRLAGGAVLIKVDAFTKGSGERVRSAVREAPEGAGILLDLRGNSGGLVSEAVTAASGLVDGGLVATYDVRGRQQALHAEQGGDTSRPVVALVDGGTMSAAELLTGALQDRGRAVVVGSRTFGKGSVQMPSRLPDGSVAELTVGHYRTPSGRAVDGQGITPDLEVDGGAETRAETVLTGLGPPS